MSEPAPEDVFNRSEALENMGGSVELLEELSQTLIEELPKLMEAAQDGIQTGDATKVSRTLHSIKGSVTPFAATRAHDAAWKLEQSAAAGDLNHAENLLADLEVELNRLTAALLH